MPIDENQTGAAGGNSGQADPQTPTQNQVDIDNVISMLTQAGINSSDQLAGHLQNSREFGRVANLLGDARNEIAAQKEELVRLNKTVEELRLTGRANAGDDIYGDTGSQHRQISLDDIENAVLKVISKVNNAANEEQQKLVKQFQEIQTDNNFHLVSKAWQAMVNNPRFKQEVSSGMYTPRQAYDKLVLDFHKRLSKDALAALQQMRGGKSNMNTPILEQGDGNGRANILDADGNQQTAEQKLFATAREKKKNGLSLSDEEELALLDATLGMRR